MTHTEKVVLWIVKIGLFSLAVLPLYISSGMLFPFITGKNFFFRIIVEIIFALWVGLAIARSEFRPKLTPLFKAVTVFLMILFLADLFGTNPYRSFFSNYERMEGFMMLFHLYLYFVMLVGVFKTRKDWITFFHVTLAASVVVGFIGLLQKLGYRVSLQGGYRVDSTIGNPTYLAAYLMFHVWMLVILLKAFWKKWWLRLLYGATLLFELLIIYFTATRGASIALFVSAFLLLLASVIYWQKLFPAARPAYRRAAIGVIALFVILPILFWQFRNASWIPQNSAFSRLASISLQDRTTQARFSIWGMSLQGALERPILGWGQENYYLVFQKYFDPKLHSSEPWFDRSHNLFFDWLVHAGFLGLLAFLSIWATAFWGLWRMMRVPSAPLWEVAVVMLALLSHFIQNIFVFDNLNTYFLFFAFLAYGEFQSIPQEHVAGEKQDRSRIKTPSARNMMPAYVTTVVLFGLVASTGYLIHLKPMHQANALIRALISYQSNAPFNDTYDAFQKALSYGSFGTTEVREQLGNTTRMALGNDRYSADEKKKLAELAIEELKKEISGPAKDVKHLLFLAAILNRAASFNPPYITEAENLLKEAIAISPTKQIVYFELTQAYLSQNKTEEALHTLHKVFQLEPHYQQAAVNLMIVAQLSGRKDLVEEAKPYVEIGALDEDALQRVAGVYRSSGDMKESRAVLERLVEISPTNVQYRATLAAVLAELGEFERAISEAEYAAKLDPSFAEEAKKFIEIIKARGNR